MPGFNVSNELLNVMFGRLATLALVFAASVRVAPIRFATRVDAAMDIGKGIWNVIPVMVASTL
jgi:hypothetical protein